VIKNIQLCWEQGAEGPELSSDDRDFGVMGMGKLKEEMQIWQRVEELSVYRGWVSNFNQL
jgi:hypothetical protein